MTAEFQNKLMTFYEKNNVLEFSQLLDQDSTQTLQAHTDFINQQVAQFNQASRPFPPIVRDGLTIVSSMKTINFKLMVIHMLEQVKSAYAVVEYNFDDFSHILDELYIYQFHYQEKINALRQLHDYILKDKNNLPYIVKIKDYLTQINLCFHATDSFIFEVQKEINEVQNISHILYHGLQQLKGKAA